MVYGLWFMVYGLGFTARISPDRPTHASLSTSKYPPGLVFGVEGLGFGVWGLGFGVGGSGFRVWGSVSSVKGLGCRVQGLG